MDRRSFIQAATAFAAIGTAGTARTARAETRDVIDTRVRLTLDAMYRREPGTRDLAERARGMLVMPFVMKGGFIFGGSYGEGALLVNGTQGNWPPAGYYSVASASVGLQAGVQRTSHTLFFMTDEALEEFRRSDGWEIGAEALATFPERGMNLQVDSTTANKPVIAVVFGEDGLMLGASLEGAKYSPITR